MKTYTITKDGEIEEISPYSSAPVRVSAKNKSEAAKKMLSNYRHQMDNLPALFVKNGAYLLVTAEANGRFNADSGAINRASSENGRVFPLCSAGYASFSEAEKDSNFKYYASEDFQAQNA